MTSFRDNSVFVEQVAGRFHIRIVQGTLEPQTLAIREHREVAQALLADIRAAVAEHTDEKFEMKRVRERIAVDEAEDDADEESEP